MLTYIHDQFLVNFLGEVAWGLFFNLRAFRNSITTFHYFYSSSIKKKIKSKTLFFSQNENWGIADSNLMMEY